MRRSLNVGGISQAFAWAMPARRRRAHVDPAGRLVKLLEKARPVPLVREMRVRSSRVYELVAELRASEGEPDAVVRAAEAVEDAVRHATPVPLTDEVRLSQKRLAELTAGLRAAGA